jgi:hypothetical protein
MSKGDAPRNCFSKEWFSNYDDIDWTGSITTITPGISTVEGIIRQTLDIPLPDCGCPDDQSNNNQKDCCAD